MRLGPLDMSVANLKTNMSLLQILREVLLCVICGSRRTYMTEQNQVENQANATQPETQKRKSALASKWGQKVIDQGYCAVPSLLLRAQKRLKLNPSELAVLLQIIDHWWDSDRNPYPSKAELSDRLGISQRQVQRYIGNLEKEGLLERVPHYGFSGGRETNRYDLQGLVQRLAEIEPDFREAREQGKKRRKAAARPGLKNRQKTSAKADSAD